MLIDADRRVSSSDSIRSCTATSDLEAGQRVAILSPSAYRCAGTDTGLTLGLTLNHVRSIAVYSGRCCVHYFENVRSSGYVVLIVFTKELSVVMGSVAQRVVTKVERINGEGRKICTIMTHKDL